MIPLKDGVYGEHTSLSVVRCSSPPATSPRGRCPPGNGNPPWPPFSCLCTTICAKARPQKTIYSVFILAAVRSWIHLLWNIAWHSRSPRLRPVPVETSKVCLLFHDSPTLPLTFATRSLSLVFFLRIPEPVDVLHLLHALHWLLIKRTTTGRAQRASARSQNGAVSILEPPAEGEVRSTSVPTPDLEALTMVVDDEPSISRSNSSGIVQETSGILIGRSRRKDKGKATEAEPSVVRVKEEPKSISLLSPEPSINVVRLCV